LKLAPLVLVPPCELRGAEWSEFDFDNSQWRIPGSRMKMGDPRIVSLSRQAVVILPLPREELRTYPRNSYPLMRAVCHRVGEFVLRLKGKRNENTRARRKAALRTLRPRPRILGDAG
jgi:integrase